MGQRNFCYSCCSNIYNENNKCLPLSVGFVTRSKRGWYMSNITSLRPGRLLWRLWEVLFSLLLKEAASWFKFGTHWLLPRPNRVMAAGKHPNGGRDVTPIFLTPKLYRLCHQAIIFLETDHCVSQILHL